MGTKYSTQSISGYNSSPPADDGTVAESNRGKWATIKTKLGDPVKTLAEAINTAVVNMVDNGPTEINTGYTTTATDYGSTLIMDTTGASPTVELLALASCPDGYHVYFHNKYNASNSAWAITVDGGGNISGVNGIDTTVTLERGESVHFQVSDDKGYYFILSSNTVLGPD